MRRILVASNAIKTIDNDRNFKKLGGGLVSRGTFKMKRAPKNVSRKCWRRGGRAVATCIVGGVGQKLFPNDEKTFRIFHDL
jgi:hypothetical protein